MTSLKKLLAVLAASLPLAVSAQPAPEPPPSAPPPAAPEATPPPAPPAPTPPPATPAPPAVSAKVGGVTFKFSGDFYNRAMVFTDQAGFFAGSETIAGPTALTGPTFGRISDNTLEEAWAELKYRFQFEGSTENGLLRGVYNIEVGAIRFGDSGNKNVSVGTPATNDAIGTNGGGYSGDGDNYETRFAYLDIGLPSAPKHRFTLGLQPFTVNKYLWSETATGVQYKGPAAPLGLTLAWMRGRDVFTSNTVQEVSADGDNFLARGDFAPSKDLKVGAFVLYQHQNPEAVGATFSHLLKRFSAATSFDIVNGGIDGALRFGNLFVNFDGIYQWGDLEGGIDLSSFFAHADVGVDVGALKLTYTGWYASGDKTPGPGSDAKNFIATDVDIFDSIILFEGGFTDDNYFTEAPYFLNFGAIFNKVAADFKLTPMVTVGAAAMYVMTAEDITLPNGATENVLGTEIDAYVAYKPMPGLEIGVNAGYLIAGDAMDQFEGGAIRGNGKADADIFRSTARVRYQF